jgi:hypothetical protein
MTSTATVYRAALSPDGHLSAWTEARALPETRSHHAAFVSGSDLYVVGGLRGNPTTDEMLTLSDVLRAHVEADGSLGPWTAVSKLDVPLATEAASVAGGYVYLFGGLETEEGPTAHVRRAALRGDGSLGAWELASPLLHARAHDHQVPIVLGRAYAVSGNGGEHDVIDKVDIGALP